MADLTCYSGGIPPVVGPDLFVRGITWSGRFLSDFNIQLRVTFKGGRTKYICSSKQVSYLGVKKFPRQI